MRRVLASLLILGFMNTGLAGAGEAPARPFFGQVQVIATEDLDPAVECPVTHHQSHAVGEATHLGPFTEDTEVCGSNLRLVVEPPFAVEGGPPYIVADFTVDTTWTADNGDQVALTGSGVRVQLPDGRTAIQASLTIDDGSGRFQGANGELSASKGIDEAVLSLTGRIDYDASQASG